jgi:tripartite-type tricarboxylate transporter receptor subunit TctC
VLDKLNAAVNRAISSPDARSGCAQLGSEGGGGTPEEFAALIRRDSAKWAEVVKRSGAKIDEPTLENIFFPATGIRRSGSRR